MVGLSPCCLYRVVETGFVDTGLPTPCYRGTALPREYGFSLIDSVAIAIHTFCKGLRTPREAPAEESHPYTTYLLESAELSGKNLRAFSVNQACTERMHTCRHQTKLLPVNWPDLLALPVHQLSLIFVSMMIFRLTLE